jgi:acetolactate synthase-1/2/3 large subunit
MTSESSAIPSPATAAPRGERMTGAQAVVRSLEALGVSDVFGLPGGAVLPLYDTLMDADTLRHVLVRHEQGGGHAAEAFAPT